MSAAALSLVPRRLSLSLFELVADVDNITGLVFSLDDAGEMTPEIEEQLQHALIAAVSGTRAKVDRTAAVLERFESAQASALAESARLATRAASFARYRERLETYVLCTLEASKLDKLEGDTSTLARRKNPAKVQIDDENAVPADFWRYPEPPPAPPPVVDKKLVGAALKAKPDSVAGCRLVQGYRLVRS